MSNRRPDLRSLEPWRRARTPAGRALIAAAVQAVEAAEQRQRRRRTDDQATFLGAVEAIVADVAHEALAGSASRIIAPRSKRHLGHAAGRYSTPIHTTVLPSILDGLHAAGMIRQRIGDSSKFRKVFTKTLGERRERMPSIITHGPALIAALGYLGITFGDFEIDDRGELIVLRGARPDRRSEPPLLDYADTEQTREWRRELTEVNAWLRAADLAMIDASEIDTGERHMRRVFGQGSFECGGRLAGPAFWLRLPRALRSQLRIDGEQIAVVDFASMFPRLVYALAKEPQPAGDIYELPGIGREHRGALKRLVAARLFDTGPRRSWPRRTPSEIAAGVRPNPQMTVRKALELIAGRHPVLARHFGCGLGHRLMRVESDIMLGVLRRAMQAGITVLPLHDGVLCAASRAGETAELMREAAREMTGCALPVG